MDNHCNKDNCNKDNCHKKICNEDFFRCCNSCYPASVTAVAYFLAQNYDKHSLELLTALLSQLTSTLAAILTINELNEECKNSDEEMEPELELFESETPPMFF